MKAPQYKVDYMRDLMLSGVFVICCHNLSIFGGVMDGVVPDGSTSTVVPLNDPTQNIEIQIASPNTNGTSWNNYTHFNVPAPGVTLNNGVNADLIVNNVTSANTTTWLGELSVSGDPAHVILSNPNGILIDGGRGANISSLVVTTGSVSNIGVPADLLDILSIDTTQGLIDIGNGGLGGVFSSLNLISKEIRINGSVKNESNLPSGMVRLIAGDSVVETSESAHPSGVGVDLITNPPAAGSGGAPNTELIVNLDQLGGITSSRISVIITDQGAGVNINNGQISATSDFRISADGRIVMSDSSLEAEQMSIISASDTSLDNATLNVGGDIDVLSAGLELIDSQVEALGYLVIESTDMSLENTDINIGRDSTVNVNSLSLSNNSAWQSENQILDIAGTLANNGGNIIGLNSVNIGVGSINQTNQGLLASSGSIDLSITGSLSNDNSFISAEGDLNISADSLTQSNNAEISSGFNADLNITNAINNESSNIIADQELDITGSSLTNTNESVIVSENTNTTLDIFGDINNDNSAIEAESELVINASNLVNTAAGLIESDTGNIDLNLANNLQNESGKILAANDINIKAADIVNEYTNGQRAEIIAEGGELAIDGDSLNNTSSLIEGERLTINLTGDLENTYTNAGGISIIFAEGDGEQLTINTGGAIKNHGSRILSNGDVDLGITGSLSSDDGFIRSEGDLNISADSLTQSNNSEISSGSNADLNITNAINNESSNIIADQELDITGSSLINTNESVIVSENANATLDISGDINNDNSAIEAESELIINASSLTNIATGLIESDTGNIDLNLANNLRNESGKILAANDINIEAADIVNEYANGQRAEIIAEAGELAIDGDSLNNTSSLIEGERLTINLTSDLENTYTNAGGISIIFAEGDGEQLTINTDGVIDNYASRIISNGDMDLQASGPIRSYVQMTNNGQMQVERRSYRVFQSYFGIKIGKKVRSLREIFPNLESVDELPYLVSNGDMNIASDEEFENIGGEVIVNGSGNLAITAPDILNQNVRTGELYFEKQCRWGCKVSGHSTVESFGGNMNVAGDAVITASNNFTNSGGILHTEGDLNITANQVTNVPTTLYGTYHLHRGPKFWGTRGHRIYGYSEGGILNASGATNISSVQPIISSSRVVSPPMEDQIGIFEDIFDSLGIDF